MSNCSGNGECLEQCWCECYDEETDEYYEICSCIHKNHIDGYCPSSCCKPIECRNYKYCNDKVPQYILDCNFGMCINCAVKFGRHKFSKELIECPICLENTDNNIILKCNHKLCNDCWCKIININSDEIDEDVENNLDEDSKNLCPLCRNINDYL